MVKLWALTQKLEGSSADSVREKKKKKRNITITYGGGAGEWGNALYIVSG